jgi:hypothetical protein
MNCHACAAVPVGTPQAGQQAVRQAEERGISRATGERDLAADISLDPVISQRINPGGSVALPQNLSDPVITQAGDSIGQIS